MKATLELTTSDCLAVRLLILDEMSRGGDPLSGAWHDGLWSLRRGLPEVLSSFLNEFSRTDGVGYCLLTGLPTKEFSLQATPQHWKEVSPEVTRAHGIALALLVSTLGDVFAWSTLQRGRLLQDVLPIAGEEGQQSGHGSSVELAWHTEDGFHELRCDYLALLGLRNPGVPTTLASIRDVTLSSHTVDVLREPRFLIYPDDEHLRQPLEQGVLETSHRHMRSLKQSPAAAGVLFGAYDAPFLRIDPVFMQALPGDRVAAEALRELIEALDACLQSIIVRPGDLLVVDNYVMVHGRAKYTPAYNGCDRWLKKALVTRDLRRSRTSRSSASARVLS